MELEEWMRRHANVLKEREGWKLRQVDYKGRAEFLVDRGLAELDKLADLNIPVKLRGEGKLFIKVYTRELMRGIFVALELEPPVGM